MISLSDVSGLIEANEKEQFIEIWLGHLKVSGFFCQLPQMSHASMKSFAKSSRSSLHSTTSSVSSAARSSTKAIGAGIKRIKSGTNKLVRPLKRAKHALSNVSSPIISNTEDNPATDDRASIKTNELLDAIMAGSEDELDDLEKTFSSLLFSFLVILLISTQSGGQGNLEVSDIHIL